MREKKFFGTDGIRGVANKAPIDPEFMTKLGIAAGSLFKNSKERPKVVIGKDTRLSGYLLETGLTSGFISVGMDVILVGPVPTPAISMLTKSLRADLGVMISASHNPYIYNGVKFFKPDGYKLDDDIELEIEKRIIENNLDKYRAKPEELGRAKRLDDAPGRYIEFVKNSFLKKQTLDNIKIVLDSANGAAYKIAPTILTELGAEVISIADNPDGVNINHNCGSTYPKLLQAKVKQTNADIGIALDGDADRLIVVDEKGRIVDGDNLIAAIAMNLKANKELEQNTVVVTQMSNLALEHYLNSHKINIVRSKVGDRYVIQDMKKLGVNFGGEQSGHIIFSNFSTTGDGLIAALQILSILVKTNKKVSEICNLFEPMPQILTNIPFEKDMELFENKKLWDMVESCQKKLGQKGRILIRPSGTEPLLRIMGEAQDSVNLKKIISELSENIGSLFADVKN